MKKILILFILLLNFSNVLRAQNSINSGGADATQIVYSIGQVFYEHDNTIRQGVHHPYHIQSVKTTLEAENISIRVYPNPVKNMLTLHFTDNVKQDCKYVLCDINGRILYQQTFKNSETQIDLSNLNPSIFFLQIISQGKPIKIFKIVKST